MDWIWESAGWADGKDQNAYIWHMWLIGVGFVKFGKEVATFLDQNTVEQTGSEPGRSLVKFGDL